MAIMIPEKPRAFKPESREDLMFEALKQLPDSYYVVHSFRINKVSDDNSIYDSEADFVVFHPHKGIVCIEAKASKVSCYDGEWYYANGEPMHSGGPFAQARRNMYAIRNHMEKHNMQSIVERCKFLNAVWFPIVTEGYIRKLTLPLDADYKLILTEEALQDPETYLDDIFSVIDHGKKETNVKDTEAVRVVNEILCPQFEIAPSATFDTDTKHILFHRLLKEQAAVLNFLEDQRTAIINGAAGTGKTLVAVEKAKRHAFRGEKVLFLCFNKRLRDHLAENYAHENIDYETIAHFACHIGQTREPNYDLLSKLLEDMVNKDNFPYQHVIVDEGQDFGNYAIEEANILSLLKTIIEVTKDNGSFYVFYDKLQMIQSRKPPEFLEDADCKLTLYRNCRNTENIAKTSLRPVSEERSLKLIEDCIVGRPAELHYCIDVMAVSAVMNKTLEALRADGITNIVILSCKDESNSMFPAYLKKEAYPAGKKSVLFTTCRKFKGLEADAVILVDVDEDTFLGGGGQNVLLYYVGASRARLRLYIITTMDDDGCIRVLKELSKTDKRVLKELGKTDKIKRPQRVLANALNALPK